MDERERKGQGASPQGGGLGERAMKPATEDEPLSGTGGAAGGGTIAGKGEPSGENTDFPRSAGGDVSRRGAFFEAPGKLPGRTGSEEAAEAAALGPAPGGLADEAATRKRQAGAAPAGGGTIGDALKSGEEPQVGSGTPPDHGELGGGEPMAESGTTGPSGTRSPGGESRK